MFFLQHDREWHPFTLSSGPHDEFNEVNIKALGDFTGDLLRRVTTAALTQVTLFLAIFKSNNNIVEINWTGTFVGSS